MKDSRNHHFTPRWYLRRFAHSGPKKNNDEILVYGFAKKEVTRISARGVGAKNDFNRLEIDGAKPTWLETQWTDDHETPARVVIEGIDSTGSLPKAEDLETLLRFLSLLFCRNPRMRKMNGKFDQMLLQEFAEKAVLSNEGWSSFAEWCELAGYDFGTLRKEGLAEALAKNGKVEIVDNPFATFQCEQILATQTLVGFRAREWLLVESASGEEFWTSDYPVLEFSQSANNTDIFFPLSPTRCLVGQQLIGCPPPKLSRTNMGYLNAHQASSAEHFVVMRDPSRITLYHDDTGPQHWTRLIDGTRYQDRLLPRVRLWPRGAPVFGFWKDPRVHKSDD